MRRTAVVVMILTVAFFLLSGCGSSETDVTALPKYNFSSFAGTTWKTKTKVALADLQDDTYLLAPRSFDSAHPEYQPPPELHVLAVLPVGTRLRIDRLMEFRGNRNCALVIASLIDEAGAQKTAYLDYRLLAGNAFMGPDSSLPPTWAVNPDLLEAADTENGSGRSGIDTALPRTMTTETLRANDP